MKLNNIINKIQMKLNELEKKYIFLPKINQMELLISKKFKK